MVGFSTVWRRIERHAGEIFYQIKGGEFTYSIEGGSLIPNRTNRRLPKMQFEKAFDLVPLESTVPIQSLQGPSYIYAVLMDDRIRGGDW